jgi:hypothetical protein
MYAAGGVAGAAFTTTNPLVDRDRDPNTNALLTTPTICFNGPDGQTPAINCNIYDQKQFVWLNGGPDAAGLESGTYFWVVMAPGGQPTPLDGGVKNLSDDTDLYTNRIFTWVKGTGITAYGGTHSRDGNRIRVGVKPPLVNGGPDWFADTPNNGGVYILGICSLEAGYDKVTPRNCKYDAFKVRKGNGTENDVLDAAITIGADATNEVGDSHTFDITLSVFGGSPPYTATITPSGGPDGSTTSCGTPTNLGGGIYACTYTVNSSTPTVITAHAAAVVEDAATPKGRVQVETDGVGENSGDAVKTYADMRIRLSPLTAENGIGESHTVTATVEKKVGNASNWSAVDGASVSFSIANTSGATASVIGGSTSTTGSCTTNTAGTCTVTFNSPTAGIVTTNAVATASISGVSITRATSSSYSPVAAHTKNISAGGTGSVNKAYIAGSLSWLKNDQDAKPLGGATFQVCRTSDHVSGPPESFPALAVADCFDVLDNDAKDTNKNPGQFAVAGLMLGDYRVREAIPPSSDYAMDQTERTARLSLSAPNASFSTNPFVNRYRFKGETATGAGYSWAAAVPRSTSNWFMFSPFRTETFPKFALLTGGTIALLQPTAGTQVVDLIAGQQYKVGTITMDANRNMTIAMTAPARFLGVAAGEANVKVEPMPSCSPSKYIEPGQFRVKRTASGSAGSLQILKSGITGSTLLNAWNGAACYAVHVDVERQIIPPGAP